MDANPLKFFWDFSKRIKHQHLTFSVDVRLSLARILRKVQWWSVSMVTRYDVISSRGSNHFERKCMFFFQLFSTIKVNLVAKIMPSAYLCIIIHVKQLPFLAVLTWFLVLGKIQDGGHCWWRHRPPAASPFLKYTSSCWEDQRLFSEGKIASKHCNISKTRGRVPSALLLYLGGGYDFACTSEG